MEPRNSDLWRKLVDGPAGRLGNVLDIRAPESFAAGHLAGAVNMPLAADDVADAERLAELLPGFLLPPRHEPMLVCGPADAAAAVAGFLAGRGRPGVEPVSLTADSVDALPRECLEKGRSRRRLWRPPPFLAGHYPLLAARGPGAAVDLGSGSGRASVWLAERGWRVTAVDRHPKALAMAGRLAADAAVDLTTLRADLTDPAQVPPGPWDATLALRFLDRPLLGRMAGLLAPGGVALVRTYRWREEFARRLPARQHCLEPGELPGFFPAADFEVLVAVEDEDPDGAPAAGVVARRL